MQTKIFVRTQFEGFHSYINAPEQVKYLRDLHRHIFHVEITMTVFHDDREIEFIMLKNDVNTYLDVLKNTNHSCEQYAELILNYIENMYSTKEKHRYISVSVSEDNENGAIVSND